MKKYLLLFAVAGLVTLQACNQNTPAPPEMTLQPQLLCLPQAMPWQPQSSV